MRRAPRAQQAFVELEDLHLDGVAVGFTSRVGSPEWDGEITAGAGGGRHQQIDLSEQLEVVAHPRRARLHEIELVLVCETCDLEYVDDVMYVELRQPVGENGPSEV